MEAGNLPWDPCCKMSIINPILVRILVMSYRFGLFQNMPLVKEGGIVILVHPCKRQFDALRYPCKSTVLNREKLHTYDNQS
jgi:hypothetical protein